MNKRIKDLFKGFYIVERREYISESMNRHFVYELRNAKTCSEAEYDIIFYPKFDETYLLSKREYKRHRDLLEVLENLPTKWEYFMGA